MCIKKIKNWLYLASCLSAITTNFAIDMGNKTFYVSVMINTETRINQVAGDSQHCCLIPVDTKIGELNRLPKKYTIWLISVNDKKQHFQEEVKRESEKNLTLEEYGGKKGKRLTIKQSQYPKLIEDIENKKYDFFDLDQEGKTQYAPITKVQKKILKSLAGDSAVFVYDKNTEKGSFSSLEDCLKKERKEAPKKEKAQAPKKEETKAPKKEKAKAPKKALWHSLRLTLSLACF